MARRRFSFRKDRSGEEQSETEETGADATEASDAPSGPSESAGDTALMPAAPAEDDSVDSSDAQPTTESAAQPAAGSSEASTGLFDHAGEVDSGSDHGLASPESSSDQSGGANDSGDFTPPDWLTASAEQTSDADQAAPDHFSANPPKTDSAETSDFAPVDAPPMSQPPVENDESAMTHGGESEHESEHPSAGESAEEEAAMDDDARDDAVMDEISEGALASGSSATADWRISTGELEQAAGKEDDDTQERIRVAAATAAQAAEDRSIDEILALEDDLERAKREAAAQLEAMQVRLDDAERRATEASDNVAAGEAAGAAAAEDETESAATDTGPEKTEREARAGASKWLRDQVKQIQDEAAATHKDEIAALQAKLSAAEAGP